MEVLAIDAGDAVDWINLLIYAALAVGMGVAMFGGKRARKAVREIYKQLDIDKPLEKERVQRALDDVGLGDIFSKEGEKAKSERNQESALNERERQRRRAREDPGGS